MESQGHVADGAGVGPSLGVPFMEQQNVSLENKKPMLKASGQNLFDQIQGSAANAENISSWKFNPLVKAKHRGKTAKPTNLNFQSRGSKPFPRP